MITDAQLIALFEAWRADIDSVPYAREDLTVGDLHQEVTRWRA